MMRRNGLSVFVVCVLVLLVSGQIAVAQNYWLRSAEQTSVTLDIFKPSFDVEYYDFLTSVVYLSGYIEATDQLAVIIEFPIANADIGTDFGDFSETQFGNPYFGGEYKMSNLDKTQAGVFRLGVRPPIASDEKWIATEVGYVGMFDRFEAFFPDVTTLSGGGGYRLRADNGYGVDADVNGNVMFPSDGDTELYIDYNLAVWFFAQQWRGGMGFAGRMLATESDMDFGERTIHQLGAFASYDFGQFRPGAHFRLPIDDDLGDVLNFVWGISLAVEFE